VPRAEPNGSRHAGTGGRVGPARGGFQWWAPHDRARRSAELLLAGVATICALYVAIAIVAVVVGIRIGQAGSEHPIVRWQHRVGPVRLTLAAVVLVVALAALIRVLASDGLTRRAMRLANARPLADGEAEHTKKYVESFAIGVGFATPPVGVVEDPALNGFAIGRRRTCAVCLTSGALALPSEQLDALCAQVITAVANRALPVTCAAADLVLVARWFTRAVWGLLGLILVSTIVGVPPLFAAAVVVAITLVVAGTMPLLALADRAIPRLRDRSTQLADLNSVAVTNQPAPLARLLLTAADDRRAIAAPWQIAHLWFDADTKRRPPGGFERRFETWLDPLEGSDPRSLRPDPAAARRTLIERARVLVDMTSGDPDLCARLERAERK